MATTEFQWPEAVYPGQEEIIAAYAKCSAEVVAKSDTALALKTGWNRTVPIARVPDELLLLVFEDWASECYVEISRTQPTFRPYAWITCTHVCRRWRELALSSPCLWRRIVPASPEWTQELLSRSRQTALCVNFNSYDAKTHWDVDRVRAEGTHHLLRHQFHRFRETHMDAFDKDNPSGVSAPLLTSLQITGFYENPIAAFLFRSTLNVSSTNDDERWVFAQDGLPRLKRLDVFIAKQSTTWTCFRPTLTSLRTRCIRPRPSPAAWLAALAEMPNLRSLELDIGCPSMVAIPEWHPPQPAAGPITLPALRSLTITDECDGRASTALLRELVLPAVARVDVDLLGVRHETEAATHLAALLDVLRPLTRGCVMDSVELDVHASDTTVDITLSPLRIQPDDTYPPSLSPTWTPGRPYVRLCASAQLTQSELRQYLRAMADVRVVRVGGDLRKITTFVDILKPASRRTTPDPAKRAPIFPHLNTLRLLGIYWKKADAKDQDTDDSNSEEEGDEMFNKDAYKLVKQTSMVMQSRRKAGFQIPYIVLAEKLSDLLNVRNDSVVE